MGISFLSETIQYIEKLNSGEAHECTICMGDCPPDSVSVTRCGHIFCTSCISGFVEAGKSECPTCRGHLGKGDFDPIARLSTQRAGVKNTDIDHARYGTKIARIIA